MPAGAALGDDPPVGRDVELPEGSVWWRPHRRAWWMAVLFAVGSLCFALAALAAQWASNPRSRIDVTFFAGSILFTAAACLQYLEAAKLERLAAAVQLLGTIFFNISTFAAMKHGLSTSQSNRRVWAPDVFGSVCFLVSSGLAYVGVCHRWLCLRWGSLSWRIAALNLLGSVAFGAAAIASLTEPSSGELVSARVANAGTALGGLCFLAASIALMPQAAAEDRGSAARPPAGAPAG
jgi:hypothetical protein